MNKLISRTFVLLAGLLLVSSCGNSDGQANSTRKDFGEGIWYGPGSINTVERGLRADFMAQVTDKNNWPTVYKNTAVFKQFIETLYLFPKHGDRCYSDKELKRLAEFVTGSGFQSAFEVGALRWEPHKHGPGSGEKFAQEEIELLQRWVKAGGTVDYLTADHAVMWNVGLCLQGAKPMAGLEDPDWRKVLNEVVDSLAMMHEAFPDARIGMIESLGYFTVGKKYTTTDPDNIYPIDFEEFLRTAKKKLRERGVELDHMHLDFSYQDCKYDGRNENRLDFGRIIAAEKIIKSLGLECGMIINAFDDLSYGDSTSGNMVGEKEKAKNPAARSASAVENTLEYFDGYVAAGGDPDSWIFERWQPYPDKTGPETDPNTDMGVTRLLVEKLKKLKE